MLDTRMAERFWNNSDSEKIQHSPSGDRLVFGTSGNVFPASSVAELLAPLPDEVREYTVRCMDEHGQITKFLLESGYVPVEICFRDYLSGPHDEIAGTDTELLSEAFEDSRYELVPTIVFALENDNGNAEGTGMASLFIEYHTKGMAF